MKIVHFQNVGRGKRCWDSGFPGPLTIGMIADDARRHGGLRSSEVDAVFISDDGSTGIIVVGGWRKVGSFTISTKHPKKG